MHRVAASARAALIHPAVAFLSLHPLRAMSDSGSDLSTHAIATLRDATKCSDCRFNKRCSACPRLVPRSLAMGLAGGGGGRACKDCGKALCAVCAENEDMDWGLCAACDALVCSDCSRTCDECFNWTYCDACSDRHLFSYNGGETNLCEQCYEQARENGEFIVCGGCYECFVPDTKMQHCLICDVLVCPDCVEWQCRFSACARCHEKVCESCAAHGLWSCGTCAVCGVDSCSSCSDGGDKCEDCKKSYVCGACQAATAHMQHVDGKTRCVACTLRCQ